MKAQSDVHGSKILLGDNMRRGGLASAYLLTISPEQEPFLRYTWWQNTPGFRKAVVVFGGVKNVVGWVKMVDCVWNVMTHAQKPDFVFRGNVRVHLNRRGHHFSRLLAAEVCASAVVMLDTPCSEVVWRVLATHSIRQFPLHFPSRASPCAITLQLNSTKYPWSSKTYRFPEVQIIIGNSLRYLIACARSWNVIKWNESIVYQFLKVP